MLPGLPKWPIFTVCALFHPGSPHTLQIRIFLLDCLNNEHSCSDDSEYEDSVYSRSDSDGEAGHSCRGAGALLSEPEIKFTSEELSGLQILVERHDEQYKLVNHDAHFNYVLHQEAIF